MTLSLCEKCQATVPSTDSTFTFRDFLRHRFGPRASEHSPVGRWLVECTEKRSGNAVQASALYNSWRAWAGKEGEFVGSHRLSKLLQSAGVRKTRRAGGTYYLDIRLTDAALLIV